LRVELGTPSFELGTSGVEHRTPSVKVEELGSEPGTPSFEVGTSGFEVDRVSVEVKRSSLEVRTLSLKVNERTVQREDCARWSILS
jgi:hypothetical protein